MRWQLRGLPIAAYLGLLVALALASAFVAMLAILLWLPPRPPDIMRADEVTERFQAGYDYMAVENRTLSDEAMIWRVQRKAPEESDGGAIMRLAQVRLAGKLDLRPDQVRIAAARVERRNAFVFQVRDVEDLQREVESAARDMERAIAEAERETQNAEKTLREAEDRRRQADEAVRAAEAASREAMRANHDDSDFIDAEDSAREAAEEARAEEDEARQAERDARASERRLRVERVRMRSGEVDVHVEMPDLNVDVDDAGRVRVHRFEFSTHDGETGEGVAPMASAGPVTVETVPAPPPAPPAASAVRPATPAPPAAPSAARTATPAPPAPPATPRAVDAPLPPVFAPAPEGVMLISGFEIGAQLPDGRWLVMRQGRNWAEFGWILRAALVIAGALAVLSLLAILFARRLTRPIRNFSDAVQAVGVNPQSEPVREEGPLELQGAARAVNTMQARLRALIADRTKTLAAVAHDMRTPLMRLRLAAENVAPETRDKMAKEIEEVESLVASFIAFARDDPAEEARVRLDLAALLQSIADDRAEAGRAVSFEGPERVLVTGQSLGLKRLFGNLVDNALKYGAAARIRLVEEDDRVVVLVEDDGPGIPPDQRESVFEPFVRLENGDAKGAGLGLPAARSIARAHGGDVDIVDAEAGTRVRVTLPL